MDKETDWKSNRLFQKITEHNAIPIDTMTEEQFEQYVSDHIILLNEYNAALEEERLW